MHKPNIFEYKKHVHPICILTNITVIFLEYFFILYSGLLMGTIIFDHNQS